MRSLAFKLTLAFLFVGVAAVALVGVFVGFSTQHAYDRLVADQAAAPLAGMLERYYQSHGSWAGLGSALDQVEWAGRRVNMGRLSVAVLDRDRDLVLGLGDYRGGRISRRDQEQAIPLTADGQTVGWLVIETAELSPRDRVLLPEDLFLQRVTRAIIVGTLGAVALALLLGFLLARTLARPIRALTAATQAVARGELGKQVPVQSGDELGQLSVSFNQMSADLARTSEARRQMTADIAHELRTPLSTVLVYAEGLEDGKLQGTPQTYAALHDTARHLQHLVDDLRTLALADAGELPLQRRPVDPSALIERAVLRHMVQAQTAGVALKIEASGSLPAACVDPERISQVLDNLVANALRHTPSGGQVVLSAAVRNDRAVLQVSDTGTGIAPEEQPFVFDRFYRGDKARKAEHGESGLGLAIARSIVESHGGTIEASSTPGAGSTFTVTLPNS